MSKYGVFSTAFKDPALLCAALADLGFSEVETSNEPLTLYGYHGDARPEKANIIIRRKHISVAANDVGFVRGADGTYEAIISQFDRGRFHEGFMGKLKQSYTEHRQMAMAKARGYVFQGREVVETEKGPTVQLRFGVR